jgi:DNA-binding transcriptional regulator YhcF (GntR family)
MPKFNGNRPDAKHGSQRAADFHMGKAPDQPQVPARVRGGRSGSSFAARFGRVILQHGIAAIPSALYHYQGQLGLSAQQVWFVSYILSHKWDEDLPYPSLKKMARCVTLSLSQLQRIKNSLCQVGYLQVYPRFGQTRGQDTNAYDFSGLFDRLEEAIMQDSPAANAIRAEGESPDMAELAELDSSFVARYGRVITRHGVAAVPRAIFTHQAALNLTPQQVWFITYIFSFQWDTTLPFPSIRRMAAITGYSTVQMHNIKSELVEAGYLRLVRRKDDLGGQDTNAYDFSGCWMR